MMNINKNLLLWLFGLSRSQKLFILLVYDIFCISIAFLLALALRLETIDIFNRLDTYIGILFSVPSTISIFTILGLYKNVTRYVSINSAIIIAVGSTVSCIVLLSFILLLRLNIPLSVSLIFGIVLCLIIPSIRLFIRYLSQNMSNKKQENTVIYGASTAGIQLMDALRQNQNYSVKLFIDDNPDLHGKTISGCDVVPFNRAKNKIFSKNIKTMFLATSLNVELIRQQVLNLVTDYPIKIKMIPDISKFIESESKIGQLKDIKIEELLGRNPVKPNDKLKKKLISNRTVLVTGAGGSIGSELCRQIIDYKPRKLILLDVSEFAMYKLFEELKNYPLTHKFDLIPIIGSVLDRKFITKVFNRFKFDTIYHAAAYKHVPLMEQNIMQCVNNNVFGTLNVAELSVATKVRNFINISTDKAVYPTSFMGASKRIAEIICQVMSLQQKDTYFSIVRFGNVLGSSGSVVPLFKKQIESGGPITLTHPDVNRFFMTISEAVQLVIQAGSITQSGDVFVLDMGKPIKILDLARRMIYLSGKKPILNKIENLKDNEIAIKITGLRPGEKLFEELTYNSNLNKTTHPHINTIVETIMKNEELQSLLKTLKDAIINDDYQKLYKNIAKVCSGVSDIEASIDTLIK